MIDKMKKLTPLVLAMSLAGCMSLAPKYERPAAPVAEAFPELAKPASAPAAQVANAEICETPEGKAVAGQATPNNSVKK